MWKIRPTIYAKHVIAQATGIVLVLVLEGLGALGVGAAMNFCGLGSKVAKLAKHFQEWQPVSSTSTRMITANGERRTANGERLNPYKNTQKLFR